MVLLESWNIKVKSILEKKKCIYIYNIYMYIKICNICNVCICNVYVCNVYIIYMSRKKNYFVFINQWRLHGPYTVC